VTGPRQGCRLPQSGSIALSPHGEVGFVWVGGLTLTVGPVRASLGDRLRFHSSDWGWSP
jgi:hypothetical protein